MRASVFAVHGLNDFNVKTKAFADWWHRLAARNVPRKLWLHNGGHGGPGGAGAPTTSAVRTAGSTTGCSASRTASWPSRACTSSARTAPTTTRPTGRRPARAARRSARLGARARARRARPGARARPQQSFVDRGRDLDTDDVLIQAPTRRTRTGSSTARRRSPATCASAARRGSTCGCRSTTATRPTSPRCSSTTARAASRRWSRAAGSTRRTARLAAASRRQGRAYASAGTSSPTTTFRGRPPDRPRRRLDRPRLHAAPEAREPGSRSTRRERVRLPIVGGAPRSASSRRVSLEMAETPYESA